MNKLKFKIGDKVRVRHENRTVEGVIVDTDTDEGVLPYLVFSYDFADETRWVYEPQVELLEDYKMVHGLSNAAYEQRRYEIAKEVFPACIRYAEQCANEAYQKTGDPDKLLYSRSGVAKDAISWADALLRELKEGGKNEEF